MTREEIYSRFEELDKKASLGGGVDKIEKQPKSVVRELPNVHTNM